MITIYQNILVYILSKALGKILKRIRLQNNQSVLVNIRQKLLVLQIPRCNYVKRPFRYLCHQIIHFQSGKQLQLEQFYLDHSANTTLIFLIRSVLVCRACSITVAQDRGPNLFIDGYPDYYYLLHQSRHECNTGFGYGYLRRTLEWAIKEF